MLAFFYEVFRHAPLCASRPQNLAPLLRSRFLLTSTFVHCFIHTLRTSTYTAVGVACPVSRISTERISPSLSCPPNTRNVRWTYGLRKAHNGSSSRSGRRAVEGMWNRLRRVAASRAEMPAGRRHDRRGDLRDEVRLDPRKRQTWPSPSSSSSPSLERLARLSSLPFSSLLSSFVQPSQLS